MSQACGNFPDQGSNPCPPCMGSLNPWATKEVSHLLIRWLILKIFWRESTGQGINLFICFFVKCT